ncbi:MAG TPA: AMP-binding protein [Caulobacteraceae bacterium]|nr:AMP-binding protein [Caulobacteraceae bacterium]
MSYAYGDVFDAIAAAVDPEDAAVYCDGRVVNWGAFDRASNALARSLLAAGLKPGAKVALYMRNSPEYLVGFIGAFKARLAPVNVNYRYGVDELAYLIDNSDAEVVLFDAGFAENVRALRERRTEVKVWASVGDGAQDFERFEDLAAGDGSPLDLERSVDDMFLLYTGGTTGLPKGVMWPSGTWWNALAPLRAVEFGQPGAMTLEALQAQIRSGAGRAPVYVASPLMHGTGLFSAFAAISRGAPVVVSRSPSFEPKAALDMATRLRCAGFILVGDVLARPLLEALRAEPGRYDLTAMRYVRSSGMMWSPEVKNGLLDFMPDALLLDSFGASEGSGLGASVTSRASPPSEARFMAPNAVVLRTDDLTPLAPGSGEVGLIATAGPLPLGYYKDPEKSARTWIMVDGVRRVITGDHATLEPDGSLRLLGRGSHCINSGGEKIYPEEVEETLKTHSAVRDALVFGMPDLRLGQSVSAVASLVAGAEARDAELIAHVRRKLAPYKAPKRIAFVTDVPRAAHGKPDYPAAKVLFESVFARA